MYASNFFFKCWRAHVCCNREGIIICACVCVCMNAFIHELTRKSARVCLWEGFTLLPVCACVCACPHACVYMSPCFRYACAGSCVCMSCVYGLHCCVFFTSETIFKSRQVKVINLRFQKWARSKACAIFSKFIYSKCCVLFVS